MTIQLRPVALADLLPSLQQHISAFSSPIDSFLEDHILAANHYAIQSGATQIGWASVYEQRLLTQFAYSPYCGRGIARTMMETLLHHLPGQHVYLFTDTAVGLYEKVGFKPQEIGMGRVVGTWLVNDIVVKTLVFGMLTKTKVFTTIIPLPPALASRGAH